MVYVKGPVHGQDEAHRVKFRGAGAVDVLVQDSIGSSPDYLRALIDAGH